MRIAVIIAMEEEMDLLIQSMTNVTVDKVAGFKISIGLYQDRKSVV